HGSTGSPRTEFFAQCCVTGNMESQDTPVEGNHERKGMDQQHHGGKRERPHARSAIWLEWRHA
ncbi:MAG: hypothetical protein KA372_13520, partial [Dokdonella sp.]|uniref:hypothetical protein n=1 Tax=Dokdonella sp. TaxID=2291710 RepID=UPI001B510BED